jgi:flagellar basal body-associated protein FliL
VVTLAEGGKGKGMIYVIIGLLVLLIGLLVFVLITVLGMGGEKPDERGDFDVEGIIFSKLVQHDISGGPIVTNLLRGADGQARNVRINIGLMLYEGTTKEEIAHFNELQTHLRRTESAIWDMVIRTMRNTTYRSATSPEAAEILKETFTQKLRELYQTNFIIDVNIMDFVVN